MQQTAPGVGSNGACRSKWYLTSFVTKPHIMADGLPALLRSTVTLSDTATMSLNVLRCCCDKKKGNKTS